MKIFITATILAAFLGSAANAAEPPFIPKYGKLLIIGQQQDSIDDYLKTIGVPAGFMFYTSIQALEGLDAPANHGAGINFAQYYINHYPHTVIQLALYLVGALDGILNGSYDAHIIKLADWLKGANRPVYLRIGYEFDLAENHYDPQKYQMAYRYIVNYLRKLDVSNVAYVWHSACNIERKEDIMDWYPGDEYVDWFAVSLFNPMQIPMARAINAVALAHQKPMMIAESTPAGLFSRRAKEEWFRHYFDFINEENIKVVCYINSNWDAYPMFHGMSWGNARLDMDSQIEEKWIRQAQKNFLNSSPELFDQLYGRYSSLPKASADINAFSAE